MKKIKLFLVLSLFTLNTVIAQNNDTKITDKKKDEKSKTLEDFIKSSKKIERLFDIHYFMLFSGRSEEMKGVIC